MNKEITEKQDEQMASQQQIAVIDNGFVFVGDVTVRDNWVNINNARNIRVWGTNHGIGELRNGPLRETILDECGSVLIPLKSLMFLIPCKGF